MLNPPIRETETSLDTDREFSDFTGTRRVINIWPWLNYSFSLLLTAASQASDTFSAAAALFPAHTLLPHHASTTLSVAGQQTDSAENPPGSKIQFPNVIYHKVEWTAVWAQREKKPQTNSERVRTCSPEYGLMKLEWLSPRPWSKQPDPAPVQGTDSTSIWESGMVLVTKLPCLQNSSPEDDACSQLSLSLNSHGITMWFV